jgi:competence protein ComEC
VAHTTDARILVVTDPFVTVQYADCVRARALLQAPETFASADGRTFDYPGYLAAQGVAYEMRSASIEVHECAPGSAFVAATIALKHQFERGLAQALPEPEAGLAAGITVGDKRSVGSELTDVFKRAGLMHILVLSGYNITIILNAASYVARRLPGFVSASLNVFLAAAFVAVAGGGASAVRSALMSLAAVAALRFRRIYVPTRILGIVCFGMVMWNPLILVHDPGFQLSALATLGLLELSPLVSARLACVPEKWGLREMLSTTIATQASTLPWLLYQNGLFSLVAVPANILVLGFIPLAMCMSFIAGLGGIIVGHLFVPYALPAYLMLTYTLRVTQWITSVPLASVALGPFGFEWVVVSYVGVFVVAWCAQRKTAS